MASGLILAKKLSLIEQALKENWPRSPSNFRHRVFFRWQPIIEATHPPGQLVFEHPKGSLSTSGLQHFEVSCTGLKEHGAIGA